MRAWVAKRKSHVKAEGDDDGGVAEGFGSTSEGGMLLVGVYIQTVDFGRYELEFYDCDTGLLPLVSNHARGGFQKYRFPVTSLY